MTFHTVLVQSTQPLVSRIEKLTPLDQYTVRMYIPVACVFQVGSPALRPTVLRNLQAGLANCIDDANFLAARIVRESPDNDLIQLQYDADNAGVWFFHDEMEDVELQSIVDTKFILPKEIAARFVPEPVAHSDNCPVMAVKTTFIKGGVVLVFSLHHSILDAQGAATFAELFSKHTAAESEGRVVPESERPTQECVSSSSFEWGNNDFPRSDFQPYADTPGTSHEDLQAKVMNAALAGRREELAAFVKRSDWLIPPEGLAALKTAYAPPSSEFPTVTGNAIISALIWSRFSIARRLSVEGHASSTLLTTLNLRRRMDPQLPAEYFRNVVVLAKATAAAARLESSAPDTVYHLAAEVSKAVEWWTPERIWDFTSSIESWPETNGQIFPPMHRDLFVTIPSRLGTLIWESYWGSELGRVKEMRCFALEYFDGMVLVLPTADDGMRIFASTTPDVLERLKEDTQWTRWAEFLG